MNIQVLVATMNQKGHSLLEKMNIQSDAIVVNQCKENKYFDLRYKNNNIKWINSKERGLSKSRNEAIKNADNDICIIADDDLEYIQNYEKIILREFKKYPDADIITFQVKGIEKEFKKYKNKVKKINYINSMKISSVEIAFRISSIKKNNIEFNELFGAGSEYLMGEENIFLFDCKKKGLNIVYVPVKIANLHIGNSTWFKGYNKKYLICKGAMFTAMSRKLSYIFILQYAIRKYKLFREKATFFQCVFYMLEGRRQYINNLKYIY